MKKNALTIMVFLLSIASFLFAKDYYETGSQLFMISAGVDLPLSTSFYNDKGEFETLVGMGEDGTHLNLGGYGSIDYEVFNTSKTSLGGEIGYQFNYAIDGNLFTQVPMMFKYSYVPLQGKFEIPISLGIGLSYISFREKSMMSPSVMATIGFRFFPLENWGFGIKSGIKATFELYSKTNKIGIGTCIPVHFYATYRN